MSPADRDDEHPGDSAREDSSRDGWEAQWRDIVDNFGDRATLGEGVQDRPEQDPAPAALHGEETDSFGDPAADAFDPLDPVIDADEEPLNPFRHLEEEGTFTPPPPPPVPRPHGWRALAWAGLTLGPVIALVLIVFKVYIATWMSLLLLAATVGGFCYLIASMPNQPRDPWDDGSRV